MIAAPFLFGLVPGILVFLLTLWIKDMKLNIFIRVIPSILIFIVSGVLLYRGLIIIKGMAGTSYGVLAFFLLIFAAISLITALKKPVAK